jgi:threonine aldolase
MENAHSLGKVVPLAAMDAVKETASQWKLPVHLDGARIFNAAAALGCGAADIARRADSVMFCLSKGLCAPVGSLLAGSRDFIEEATYKRKIMGGGMRQVGILAAAGIIALTDHAPILAEDHKRARLLEKGLAKIPGLSVESGDINMVFFSYPAARNQKKAEEITELFRGKGIIINAPENGIFRFVTHYWIGDKETETILAVSGEIFAH